MKKVILNFGFKDEHLIKFKEVSNELVFSFDINDLDAEILIGDYKPDSLKNYPNLKLLMSTSVGYDAYIKKGILADGVTLCNAVDVHTEEVAEHLFALMVEIEKNLEYYRDNQTNHYWHDEGKIKSLMDLKVTIVGLGNIGKYLAKMCKALGMHVIGVKRKMIDKPEYIDELYTNADLDKAISDADVVFSILPGTKENVHLFTLDRFKKMRSDAILINGGRGNLIDTDVLYEVLDKKIIRAIGQDVFEKEPLPEDSKLWDLKNLVITPHMAGFFHLDKDLEKFVDISIENLKRYLNNDELKNVVTERE